MPISQSALEEAVLALLSYHESSLKIALKLTNSFIFSNPTNQLIAKTAVEYVKKFSNPPAGQLEYLLENDLRQGERGKLLGQQLEFLSKKVGSLDVEFIVGELDRFIEVQTLQKNLQNALELLDTGDLEGAKESAYKQNLQQKVDGTPGIWLADPKQSLKFLDRDEQEEFFSTSIGVLDHRKVTLDKKTLSLLIAAKGVGKSWWLISVGKSSIQHHKKVLHITLEMSEEKTARRYIQSLFALTKDEAQKIKVPIFEKDPSTNSTVMSSLEFERDSIISKKREIAQKLAGMYHTHLLIKEFPTGTLSTEHLYLYLENLKRERGFIPDQILIDYADLMRIDRKDLRIDTGRQYIDLRGLAVSGNYSLATATQGNREGAKAETVRPTHVGEDWSKIPTSDIVLTLSRTEAEKRMGLARILVANARDNERDSYTVLITQSYLTGQFCLDSVPMNVELTEQLNKLQG